ncbi:MAG TPA: alkaline phosphatase family protein [Thermoanaerobaculia bacterium]|jgi:phospholipase C
MSHWTRRQFIYSSAATLGSLATGRSLLWADPKGKTGLPKPDKSGIKHIVVAMMENRSFDHFLGWLPGADGRQAGLVYTDSLGNSYETHPLAPDFQGCGHPDPDHSYAGGRIEYDNGLCDGWLRAGTNDTFAIGYYTQNDLPFLGQAAPDWTVCDRYFAPIMASTYPNRIYQHAAVTDRVDNTLSLSALPTIWDRLAAAKLQGRYYFSDVPFITLWGQQYASITRSYNQFLQDCASGDLPEVAFVDPPFFGEESGGSSDDHPHGDIRAGEWWLYQTYRAVTTGSDWKHTVLVINFDEWGGFFDHVPPSEAPDVDPALALRGFRVPCVLVSPFSAPGAIDHGVYDHTSVLKMIEWRWGLPPLSARDAAANNLAEALDFSRVRHDAPDYAVPFFDSAECPGA